jgi:hypothetical protein
VRLFGVEIITANCPAIKALKRKIKDKSHKIKVKKKEKREKGKVHNYFRTYSSVKGLPFSVILLTAGTSR